MAAAYGAVSRDDVAATLAAIIEQSSPCRIISEFGTGSQPVADARSCDQALILLP